jgi:hypothetical protein
MLPPALAYGMWLTDKGVVPFRYTVYAGVALDYLP